MNARATRGPKGRGGRGPKVRGGGGRGGRSKGNGCLLLVAVGSGLMVASGTAGLVLVLAMR